MRYAVKIKHFFALIGLFAYFLLTVWSIQGAVLCVEADGTVTLESSVGGICEDAWNTSLKTQVISKKATDSSFRCPQCVDVPINMESSELQYKPFQLQTPCLTELPSFSVGYLSTATDLQMPQPPPIKPAIHRVLSTIKLII